MQIFKNLGDNLFALSVKAREKELEEKSKILRANRKIDNYILCNRERIPIEWDKVSPVDAVETRKVFYGFGFDTVTSDKHRLVKGFNKKTNRTPSLIVTHWDVALSSMDCFDILERRGISTHFSIDNDGTIYQFLDTKDIAWHAGYNRINKISIGIDFSNAYYLKYQDDYVEMGFEERPVLQSQVGYSKLEHLGYYPVQIEAYKALLKCLCNQFDIPLECPIDPKTGELLTRYDETINKGKFKGVISHYHCKKGKIDCAGLDLKKIINEMRTT